HFISADGCLCFKRLKVGIKSSCMAERKAVGWLSTRMVQYAYRGGIETTILPFNGIRWRAGHRAAQPDYVVLRRVGPGRSIGRVVGRQYRADFSWRVESRQRRLEADHGVLGG